MGIVAPVAPFTGNGEEPGHVCVQCEGEPDGKERPVAYGDETIWLHSECVRFFTQARKSRWPGLRPRVIDQIVRELQSFELPIDDDEVGAEVRRRLAAVPPEAIDIEVERVMQAWRERP
jgi:hypothetical protein